MPNVTCAKLPMDTMKKKNMELERRLYDVIDNRVQMPHDLSWESVHNYLIIWFLKPLQPLDSIS